MSEFEKRVVIDCEECRYYEEKRGYCELDEVYLPKEVTGCSDGELYE